MLGWVFQKSVWLMSQKFANKGSQFEWIIFKQKFGHEIWFYSISVRWNSKIFSKIMTSSSCDLKMTSNWPQIGIIHGYTNQIQLNKLKNTEHRLLYKLVTKYSWYKIIISLTLNKQIIHWKSKHFAPLRQLDQKLWLQKWIKNGFSAASNSPLEPYKKQKVKYVRLIFTSPWLISDLIHKKGSNFWKKISKNLSKR